MAKHAAQELTLSIRHPHPASTITQFNVDQQNELQKLGENFKIVTTPHATVPAENLPTRQIRIPTIPFMPQTVMTQPHVPVPHTPYPRVDIPHITPLIIPQPTEATQPTETPNASPPRVPSTVPMHTLRQSSRVPVPTVTPPASQKHAMTVTTKPSAPTLNNHYGHDLLPFHHANTVIHPTTGKEATIKDLIAGNVPDQDGPQ